jgi:hypothetical protein
MRMIPDLLIFFCRCFLKVFSGQWPVVSKNQGMQGTYSVSLVSGYPSALPLGVIM